VSDSHDYISHLPPCKEEKNQTPSQTMGLTKKKTKKKMKNIFQYRKRWYTIDGIRGDLYEKIRLTGRMADKR
jgi:hypothetical protein